MPFPLNPEDIKRLFEDYLDDRGLYYDFKEFIEQKGYNIAELGMEDE